MNLPCAVTTCFRKYWSTDGRARRREFWYWQVFINLATVPLALSDALVFPHLQLGPINLTFSLITFPPSLFVMVRRLNDTNRSGYWWMISMTLIGLIPLIYWLAQKGTKGENSYGADPLMSHTHLQTASIAA